jgi:hypothetical protein
MTRRGPSSGITALPFPNRIEVLTCQMPPAFPLHHLPTDLYPFQVCTLPLLCRQIPCTILQSLSPGVQLHQTNIHGSGVGFLNAHKSVWNIPSRAQLR